MSAADAVLWGCGGHAREMLECLNAVAADGGRLRLIGFIDDDESNHGGEVDGLPVLGDASWLARRRRAPAVLLGVGRSSARWRVSEAARAAGATVFPSLVHPTAVIGRRVLLEPGSYVAASAVLVTAVRLGVFAHVNIAASASHDCDIGDYATVGPGSRLTGGVRVGPGADLGAGTLAIPQARVGAWVITGAGTVIVHSTPDDVTVVGVPARVVAERPTGWYRAVGGESSVRRPSARDDSAPLAAEGK